MKREPWYESDNPDRFARGIGSRAALWTVLAVVFFGLLGAGVWAVRVVTSDVKGQGNAEILKNSAENRIAAQERFEDMYADIKATDAKLPVLAEAAKAGGPTERTALTGAKTYCLSLVGDYNAAARKFTQVEFRSTDLPYEVDLSDPSTDCQETS